MFINESQLEERLKNPRNLANRFKNRGIDATNDSRGGGAEEKREEVLPQGEKSTSIGALSAIPQQISFRTLKRPGNCRPWLSKSERTGIALAATSGRKQKEIAEEFGVQVSTVSDIVNGTRRAPDSDRSIEEAKVAAALDKVRERAIDKLMSSLDQITGDKVSAHNAKDISVICANMARVVQQTIPQEKATQQINLVVYTPELRNEKSFESVEI
jgi:predicted transcriptional regulator